MMKVRALKNLGGVVTASAGQEFEITNLSQARDLIDQGAVVPVSTDGQEVQNLKNMSSEELAYQSEINAMEMAECENAKSEAVQEAVNKLEDKKTEALNQVKQQAKQKAQQAFKQQAQAQGKMNEAQMQEQKMSNQAGQTQLDNQSF